MNLHLSTHQLNEAITHYRKTFFQHYLVCSFFFRNMGCVTHANLTKKYICIWYMTGLSFIVMAHIFKLPVKNLTPVLPLILNTGTSVGAFLFFPL